MGPRLIIVSNRVAVPEPGSNQMAGGLVVAVKAALRNRTGVWFGWSGKIDETETAQPRTVERNHITYAVIDLSKGDFEEYYNGLANRVLWPILHYRVDLQDYSRADHSGYMRVNRQFADKLGAFIRDDDVLWVHDYHLMPLARELRARGHLNPIGFFLHIPCAPLDILRTLPHHEEILGALASYDLVGFQTENDCDNFAAYLMTMPGVKAGRGLTFEVEGRRTRIGAFPVGIETAAYARLARSAARSPAAKEIGDSLNGLRLVLGVDRLDYSKGIIQRINAFDRFLEVNPEWRSRVTLLQITPRSRSDISDYTAIENEVTTLIGKSQRPLRRGVVDADTLRQSFPLTHRASRHLSGGRRGADYAASRRHEPRRQGICRGAGCGASRRAHPFAIRRGGGGAHRGADRQSPRVRGRGRGAEARVGNAVVRAARTPRPHAGASLGP